MQTINLGFKVTVKTLRTSKPLHYVLIEHPDKEYRKQLGKGTFYQTESLQAAYVQANKFANVLGIPLEDIVRIIIDPEDIV